MLDALLYVLAVLGANLTVMTLIPLPVFGFVSVGTLFFGATFTLRDRLHHKGLRFVLSAIAIAVAVNCLAAYYTGTPWRIILASFVAILLSELTDTGIYQRNIKKAWLYRVMVSNSISVPLDTILFLLIAFYGEMPNEVIVGILVGDTITKYVIGLLVGLVRAPKEGNNAHA